MLSLKDIAAVKFAVEICNTPQLKEKILCLPDSDYTVKKSRRNVYHKKQWDELLERKTGILLESMDLPKHLQEKVIGIVLLVGMRILSWARYHERALGFPDTYSYSVLNSSFFTTRGTVNCNKMAEELMNGKNLSIKQKYKLALLYCMNKYIPALNMQMAKKDKDEFYDSERPYKINQPPFVKFWSYYLKGEVDELRGDADPNLYWLQTAVKSGSKDVVEYCLEKTNLIKDEGTLIYAALEAVKNKIETTENDWTLFCDSYEYYHANDEMTRYLYNWEGPTTPNHYYVDIIYFLFSKMQQDTQIEFLKEDIKGVHYENRPNGNPLRSRVLECFLDWPYQDQFLKTIRLMWDFLPERSYVDLIRHFSCKIGAGTGVYKYGEEKNYDYRKLLITFLTEIPELESIYANRNNEIGSVYGDTETQNETRMLMSYLYEREKYTYQDKIIIRLILKNATNEEKRKIISSKKGRFMCIELMILRRWEILDEFISICYTSKEEAGKFKKELIFTEEANHVYIDFITNDEYPAFESFIRWSNLSVAEIHELKEKIILTDYGKIACLNIISSDKKLTAVDKVIRRCLCTEEKIIAIKKELLFSPTGMQKCVDLILEDQAELANEFIKWILSSDENVIQYKKYVANEIGREFCARVISCGYELSIPSILLTHHFVHERVSFHPMSRFNRRGRWKAAEKFLTWCFSSENEINDFKKSFLMRNADGIWNYLIPMHLNLISSDIWEEVEILYAWLDLSVQEIAELKKETILSRGMLLRIYISEFCFFQFTDPKINWDKIERFLRWCLKDEDDVFEFKNRFDEQFGFKRYRDHGEDVPDGTRNILNRFYLLIEDFLSVNVKQTQRI